MLKWDGTKIQFNDTIIELRPPCKEYDTGFYLDNDSIKNAKYCYDDILVEMESGRIYKIKNYAYPDHICVLIEKS